MNEEIENIIREAEKDYQFYIDYGDDSYAFHALEKYRELVKLL